MKKNLIIVLILVILIGGFVLIAKNQSATKSDNSTSSKLDRTEPSLSASQNQTIVKNPSGYVEYSKDALDQTATRRRVLYFYASWCPTCRIADPDLSANSGKFPEDLTVLRVNYNDPDTNQEEKDLAKKYAITYQHTFVQIDGEGQEVTKWNGGQTEELLENIK